MNTAQNHIKMMELTLKLAKLFASEGISLEDMHIFDEYTIDEIQTFQSQLVGFGDKSGKPGNERSRVINSLNTVISLKKARLLDKANRLIYILLHTEAKDHNACTSECELDWHNSRLCEAELNDLISMLRKSQNI